LSTHQVNCEEPPSEPANVSVKFITQTSASLTWKKSIKRGTGSEPWYLVQYEKRSFKVYTLEIILRGLLPFTMYNVTISSENNVTEVTKVRRAASVSLRTQESVPSMVRNLTYTKKQR